MSDEEDGKFLDAIECRAEREDLFPSCPCAYCQDKKIYARQEADKVKKALIDLGWTPPTHNPEKEE